MRRGLRILLRIAVVLLLLALCTLLLFRARYRDAIRSLAQTQIKNATSDLINDAIDRQIESGSITYTRIVYFEKDLDGRITALKTNMSEVNRLKTETLGILNEELLELDDSGLGIALGDLVLPELFASRGPDIPIRILSIRNADATFSSVFTQAGINQTRHQILMDVQVDATVLVLGKADSFTINSQVVVAETIIVGQVPQTFLQTGG